MNIGCKEYLNWIECFREKGSAGWWIQEGMKNDIYSVKLPEMDGSSEVVVVLDGSDITSNYSRPISSRLTKCVSNTDIPYRTIVLLFLVGRRPFLACGMTRGKIPGILSRTDNGLLCIFSVVILPVGSGQGAYHWIVYLVYIRTQKVGYSLEETLGNMG